MFAILSAFIKWLVGLAVALLPQSPFVNFAAPQVEQGLGWLNWIVPVGDILGLLEIWLVACAAWMLYRYLFRQLGGIKSVLFGSGGE